MDPHAFSEPALYAVIEVFVANQMQIVVQTGLGYSATPVISHAIVTYNRGRRDGLADGVVITPSHNPPSAGLANAEITPQVQDRANQILVDGWREVRRLPIARALKSEYLQQADLDGAYLADLAFARKVRGAICQIWL